MSNNHKVPMGMHAVYRIATEEELDMDRVTRSRVDPFMKPLIDKLSDKRPTWEFHTKRFGVLESDGYYYHHTFTIHDQGEEIGFISKDRHWRTGVLSYEFNGPRLLQERSRSGNPKTKDLNKAVKTILKNIYAPTLTERAAQARSGTKTVLSNLSSNRYYAFHAKRNTLLDSMTAFVVEHWDLFEQRPIPHPEMRARNTFREALDGYKEVHDIVTARELDRGATVFQRGQAWYVLHDKAQTDDALGYTLDTLPEHIKQGVSLLKLVKDGEVIADVGLRHNESTFYVVNGGVYVEDGQASAV